ncbi:MAG: DUF1013 domain-containing protein [Holosporales bacterium]|jgi:hypothetical protein|nr:DUF1013 domain-containing protein [Holosporales bacterium]
MPKATAIWLLENTSLTFAQIARFCGLHLLEIESLADGDVDTRMAGFDPIMSSQLTMDEIKRCERDPDASLQLRHNVYFERNKKPARKYTPLAKRQDKPDAIAWILRYYPEMSERDICALIGTTKTTIRAIKEKTHRNTATLSPRSPVTLGLCLESELEFVLAKLARSKS